MIASEHLLLDKLMSIGLVSNRDDLRWTVSVIAAYGMLNSIPEEKITGIGDFFKTILMFVFALLLIGCFGILIYKLLL
ncbi:hypothetical protein [Photobacterium angustum]|nr:hypothetical protein [Photobacterium angustum]